jgi:hypothetical protein
MSANVTLTTGGFPHRTWFVLVNCRVPRDDEHCALCGGVIKNGYVRDVRTRLVYCDTQCLAGGAYTVTKNHVRKAS